jgi:glutaredoxin-dependent peroxiredoxin
MYKKAPKFTLTNTELKPISLEDYKGKKIVILFFPLAFTSGCTKEMCFMQDNFSIYQKLDAEIIGVSVDSPFTLKKFKEDHNLSFTLGSDFNRKMTKAYKVSFEGDFAGMTGFSKRASFVIDGNGKIRYSEIAPSGEMPNFEAIQAALAAI